MQTTTRISGRSNAASILAWTATPFAIPPVRTEEQYDSLVDLLDYLLAQVGDREGEPLAAFAGMVGALIEAYEDAHVPEIASLIKAPKKQTGLRTSKVKPKARTRS